VGVDLAVRPDNARPALARFGTHVRAFCQFFADIQMTLPVIRAPLFASEQSL
jgi:hypothetical protein